MSVVGSRPTLLVVNIVLWVGRDRHRWLLVLDYDCYCDRHELLIVAVIRVIMIETVTEIVCCFGL